MRIFCYGPTLAICWSRRSSSWPRSARGPFGWLVRRRARSCQADTRSCGAYLPFRKARAALSEYRERLRANIPAQLAAAGWITPEQAADLAQWKLDAYRRLRNVRP